MLPGLPEPLRRAGSRSVWAGTLAQVNTRTAWIVYIVWRLVFFAVPFAILLMLGTPGWLAAVLAALIAVSLSVIFLSRSRDTASESIYEWRMRSRTADDIVEDEAVDAAHQSDEDPDTAASSDLSR